MSYYYARIATAIAERARSPVAHEYRCRCGRSGWSTHIDIERKPLDAEVIPVEIPKRKAAS